MTVKQVGGDHYKTKDKQHWDLMEEYDIAYLEAVATKHIFRFDKKGKPMEDLEKGVSYLKKLLDMRDATDMMPPTGVRRTIPLFPLQAWMTEAGLDSDGQEEKRDMMVLILNVGRRDAIEEAIKIAQRVGRRIAKAEEAQSEKPKGKAKK